MCQTTEAADRLLQLAFERFGFSARTYSRVLKVARTIADLEGSEKIDCLPMRRRRCSTAPWTGNTGCKNRREKAAPSWHGAGGSSLFQK